MEEIKYMITYKRGFNIHHLIKFDRFVKNILCFFFTIKLNLTVYDSTG